MADRQSLDATFFAFRKRERGGVLTMATITYLVVSFAMLGLFVYFNWHAAIDYFNWVAAMGANAGKADPTDPNAVFAAMMPPASVMAVGPTYFLLLLATYILIAAWEAACLRWMIRGEVKGLFGLSLGADTWRVYLGYWIWFVFYFVAYFAFLIVAVGAGIGVGVAAQGNPDAALPSALIVCLIVLAALAAWIYLAVRLAPAAATSVARRRFAFFDAWKVSRGRFWGLFGAFLLISFMFVVLCAAVCIGGVVTLAMATAGQITQSGEPHSMEEVMRLVGAPQILVPGIALYAVYAVSVFLVFIAFFGINARAAALALEEGKITAES